MAARKRTQEEKNLRTLRELAALPANKQCFDCHQRGPTYVNMTVGSFICTSCSGMLRGLNPPHRVKSITMTVFTPEEIEFIRNKGNEYCRYVWLGTYDTRSMLLEPEPRDEQKVKDFMIQKYERKRWYVEPDKAIRNMQDHINAVEDHSHRSGLQSATGSSGPSSQSSTPLSEHMPETKPLSNLLGRNAPPLVVQNSPAQLVSSNSWVNPNHASKSTMAQEKSVDALFGSSDFFGSSSSNQTSNSSSVLGSSQVTPQTANSVSYSVANGNFANFESAFNDCERPSSLSLVRGSSPQAYSFSAPFFTLPSPRTSSSPYLRVEASTTSQQREAFTPPPGWMSFDDSHPTSLSNSCHSDNAASASNVSAIALTLPPLTLNLSPPSQLSPLNLSVAQPNSYQRPSSTPASSLTLPSPSLHSTIVSSPSTNPFSFFPESDYRWDTSSPNKALSLLSVSNNQSSSTCSGMEAAPFRPSTLPVQTTTTTLNTPSNPFSRSIDQNTGTSNYYDFPDVGPPSPSQPRPFFPATPTSKSFGMFSPVSSGSASSTFSGNAFETTISPPPVASPPQQQQQPVPTPVQPPPADRYAALADLDSLFHQEPPKPATPPAPVSSWVGTTSTTVTLSNNNNNSSSLFGNQQPNSIFAPPASANPFTSTTSTWSSSNNSVVNPNQAVFANPFQTAAPPVVANPSQTVGFGQFGLSNQPTGNGPMVDNYTNYSHQIPPVNMQPVYFNNGQGLVGSPNGMANPHQQNGGLTYQWGTTPTNQITTNNGWGMVTGPTPGQIGAVFQNPKILANTGLGPQSVQMPANPFMSNAVSNTPRSNPSNPFL